MNVFISADIEGVCGVMGQTHWDPRGADYKRACDWMAREVNAAVEGALEAGAQRVVVKDAHGPATNLDPDKLHEAAELICGWGPLGSMVEGVDADFDAVCLIGYHARGGTTDGTLAHTWSTNVLALNVDGVTYGETGWAAVFAGHYDVPVVLVTGDDKLTAQAVKELPEGVRTVTTKTGWGHNAAWMRSPKQVREEIREAAARALKDASSIKPLKPPFPTAMSLSFRNWENLKGCEAVPGVERIDAHTFRCPVRDAIEAQKYFATLLRLSHSSS